MRKARQTSSLVLVVRGNYALNGQERGNIEVFRAAKARGLGRGVWAFRRIARAYRPTHIHVANPHYVLSVLPALLVTRTPVVYRLGDAPTDRWAEVYGAAPRVAEPQPAERSPA